MTTADMLIVGTKLMVIGMGTVFVFLSVLIGSMKLMSKLFGGEVEETNTASVAAPQPAAQGNSPETIAVLTAAIAKFRTIRGH
ncbi:MAG: OadG family protein [bacterium]